MKILGLLTFALIVIALSLIGNSFVLYKLWTWLVVPVFDVGPMSFKHSVAVAIVIGWLKFRIPSKKEEVDTEDTVYSLVHLVFGWIITLSLGWTASQFL